jgi:hypothetical protein
MTCITGVNGELMKSDILIFLEKEIAVEITTL